MAVDHLGGEVDHLPKLRFMLLPPGVPFIEHLGGVEVGPDVDLPPDTVHDHLITVIDRARRASRGNDGRDVEGPDEDRHMACPRPAIEDQSQDPALIQGEEIAGHEGVSHQDHIIINDEVDAPLAPLGRFEEVE